MSSEHPWVHARDDTVVACYTATGPKVRTPAIRTHLLVMILAESSPAEEGIPLAKRQKIQTATEDTTVETVELGAYNNCIGTMSSVWYVLCTVINIGGGVCRLCIEFTMFTIVQDSLFILQ